MSADVSKQIELITIFRKFTLRKTVLVSRCLLSRIPGSVGIYIYCTGLHIRKEYILMVMSVIRLYVVYRQ